MLSNVVSTQQVHKEYGGVVPELASRAHQKNIIRLLNNNENKTYLFGKRHKIAGINEEQDVDEFSK